MFKLFYSLFTDPLQLPLDPLWEYLILLAIGEIAHEIGFRFSPGGTFGSLIYWVTKIIAFVVVWAVLYIIIVVVKFIISHWIWFAIGGGIFLAVLIGVIIYAKVKKDR